MLSCCLETLTLLLSRSKDRNLPKLCSFWLKGQCSRVVEGTCPFRPCCGTYRFPELAGSDKPGMEKLITALERQGAVTVCFPLLCVCRVFVGWKGSRGWKGQGRGVTGGRGEGWEEGVG